MTVSSQYSLLQAAMSCCLLRRDELSEEEIQRREEMPFFEISVKNYIKWDGDPLPEPLQVHTVARALFKHLRLRFSLG